MDERKQKKSFRKTGQNRPENSLCVRVKKVKCAALAQLAQLSDVGREKLIIKI